MPSHELAKKLYYYYILPNQIYELQYITYITTYDGDTWVKWHECREPIIELLKKCPAEKFVEFNDFNKYAVIFCGNFFRKSANVAMASSNFPV